MWTRLRRLIWPPRTGHDPAFIAKMRDARAFGLQQQQASRRARKAIAVSRAERPSRDSLVVQRVLGQQKGRMP